MDARELFFENETRKHQQEVVRLLMDVVKKLLDRAEKHDASKLESPEKEIFVEHTENLRGLTYGSEEYKRELEDMKPALMHHYGVNCHHPEFNSINCLNPVGSEVEGMTLIDIVEMFCDWVAATKRHADGSVEKSIEINKNRFSMSDQLAQILSNTAKQMEADGSIM